MPCTPKRKNRTRNDTYVGDNDKIFCNSCETDLLYHEVRWWSVFEATDPAAVYLDNPDHDDGEFTCECRDVVWDLRIGC
jgi:hypothetical protein